MLKALCATILRSTAKMWCSRVQTCRGKSTFLRTIGLNVILAQTFYMAMAKQYRASFFNVLSSISPSDDMMEGRSYYMAEAEALLRMVQHG